VRPNAGQKELLFFGRGMSVLGLSVGVALGLLTIETGAPNLSALFSLQSVTPIHAAPAAMLGLHWRGLRGEAVLAGMIAGLGVTLGLVFTPLNVGLPKGLDMLACGLSTALLGLFVNLVVTVTLGLLLQWRPNLFGDAAAAARRAAAATLGFGPLDIGTRRDKMINPYALGAAFLLLLFSAPFCFKPGARNRFIGDMAVWPFVSLVLSAALAILASYCYLFLWEEFQEPSGGAAGGKQVSPASSDDGKGAVAPKDPDAAPAKVNGSNGVKA
jgi:hypothetical protein